MKVYVVKGNASDRSWGDPPRSDRDILAMVRKIQAIRRKRDENYPKKETDHA